MITDPKKRLHLMTLIRDGFPAGSPMWLKHNQKIIDFLAEQSQDCLVMPNGDVHTNLPI